MRQAIEEGYILDVLKGYQSYETALKIAGKIDESDEVEEGAARQGADAVGEAAPDQHQPEGADHRRALPRQRRPPAGGQGEGDGRHRLAQGRGEVQEGDRRLHREAGRRGCLVQLPHPGRLLLVGEHGRERGMGHRLGPAAGQGRRVHRGQPQPRRRRGPGRGVQGRDVQDHAGRQQVPDRLRPAPALGDVRRQEALRRHCRADPLPAQPHPPHRGRGAEAQDVRHRLRQQARGHQGRVRAVLHQRHPGDRDRPVRRRPPRDQARPGGDLHRGAGAPGRRAVGRAQGQQRALGGDQPGQARLPAPLRRRDRGRRQGHASTPSTSSARTSPPTSGSTTS